MFQKLRWHIRRTWSRFFGMRFRGHRPWGGGAGLCEYCDFPRAKQCVPRMGIKALSQAITKATLRAEALPPTSREWRAAYRDVSGYEEALANLTSVDDVEGSISRLNAVSSALKSEDAWRARQLAERYLREDPSDDVKSALFELHRQAEARIEESRIAR